MPVKAGYLLLAGGGAVVIWAGMRGKSVTGVFRSLIGGENPAKLPGVNGVAGVVPATTPNGTGGGPVGTVANTISELGWINAVLLGIGAPPTVANTNSMMDWISHESTYPGNGVNTGGKYNPLNTTQPMPGSTRYNSDNVQNYTSAGQGVTATVKTLLNGRYPQIISNLRRGIGLKSGAEQNLLLWSGNGYSSV